MIAFRAMLMNPAQEAGIKIPPNLDNFDLDEYSHWAVYCNMQLGRRIPTMSEQWANAKLIASIPFDKIKVLTHGDIEAMGYE